MRRRLLGNRRNNDITVLSFDTVGTGDVFTIRRESDNVEQSFTYEQILDGTFDGFVSGSFGAIKEWKGNLETLSQTSPTFQMRLKSNTGNPFLDDYNTGANLNMAHAIDMSGDSVVTLILKDETNFNNQRANLVIRGSGGNLIGVQLTPTAGYVMYDNITPPYNPDYSFSYPNNGLFKLMTFSRIGGVKKFYLNNVDTALGAGGTTYTINAYMTLENRAILGSRDVGDASGKITKYRHLGVVTGADATNLDISAYNQSIMTKYGI